MPFIDYSRIGAPSYGKNISGLGDDIFEALRARALDEQKARAQAEVEAHNRATYAHQVATDEATNRRLDEQEKRNEEKAGNERMDRALAGAKEAYTSLGQDDGSFDAIVAGRGLTDKTSNPYGEAPQRPVAPQDPGSQPMWPDTTGQPASLEEAVQRARQAPPAEPGALTSDDLEKQRAEQRVADATALFNDQQAKKTKYETDLGEYRKKQQNYQGELDTFKQREADFPKQQRDYAEHTVHELTLPNGQTVKMDVATARYAARSKNATDMRDSVMPQLTSEMSRAKSLGGEMGAVAQAEVQRKINLLNEHVQAVMGGAEKPDVAFKQWNADVRDSSHEARIQSEGQLNRESAERRTHEMATRPQASISLGNARLGFDETKNTETRLRQDATRWQGVETAKALGEDKRVADQLIGKLSSNEPGTVKNGIMELYRLAQHDNRMSDKDAVIANKIDQSVISQIQNWVNLGATGLPGDLNIAAAIDTARRLKSFYANKRDSLETDWHEKFVKSGRYDTVDADILGAQMIPGYKRETAQGATPDGRKPHGGGGKSGSVSAGGSAVPTDENGDPDIKALRQLLGGP